MLEVAHAVNRPAARIAGLLAAGALIAAGCGGGGGGGNAKRFSGTKKQVASVVDQLQSDARDGKADAICHELFTDRLAGVISVRNDVPCAEQVKRQIARKDAKFEVKSMRVRGKQAVARVVDFTGKSSGVYFIEQGGTWRIDSIYSLGR